MKHIIKLILINIVVTAVLVLAAYQQRGYFAIGAEWIVCSFIYLTIYCLRYDDKEETKWK